MKLTSENVEKVFTDCLFSKSDINESGELNEDAAKRLQKIEGIMSSFGFDSRKITMHQDEIISMLDQLPDSFKKSIGGGQSFLNACITQDGEQWGEHSNIEQLICLGLSLDYVSFPFPKSMWNILPGGMPYLTVKS